MRFTLAFMRFLGMKYFKLQIVWASNVHYVKGVFRTLIKRSARSYNNSRFRVYFITSILFLLHAAATQNRILRVKPKTVCRSRCRRPTFIYNCAPIGNCWKLSGTPLLRWFLLWVIYHTYISYLYILWVIYHGCVKMMLAVSS